MNEKTVQALDAMRRAVAQSESIDESELEITICIPRESNCKNCGKNYPDESGYDSCSHCGASFSCQINDDNVPEECWLCSCGNFIEDGLHCTVCQRQPPWGCPCNFCEDGDEDENEDEYPWCGEFDNDADNFGEF